MRRTLWVALLVGSLTIGVTSAPAGSSTESAKADAPILTDVALEPRRLPTGKGAALTVTTSAVGTLTGVVQRQYGGSMWWLVLGTKTWTVSAGRQQLRLRARVAGQRLRTGTYRLVVTAHDATGASSATRSVRFRVDRG